MITNLSEQGNPNFGALYMPNKKTLVKKLGGFGEQAESIRPKLEELAKNIDIFITPKRMTKRSKCGFQIKVTEQITNPIQRFFGSNNGYVADFAGIEEAFWKVKLIGDLLLEKTIAAREKYLMYNQNSAYGSNNNWLIFP